MRRAGPLGRDHARSHWRLGRTDRAEQLAVRRLLEPAKHIAALASWVVRRRRGDDVEAMFGVKLSVTSAQSQSAHREFAQSAPLERVAKFEDLGDLSLGDQVAVGLHRPDILVLYVAAAFVHLADQHQDGLHHVQGLEAGHHNGLFEFGGQGDVGRGSNHRTDMRRPDKTIDQHPLDLRQVGGVENGADGGGREHVVAEDAEVCELLSARQADGEGRRRGGRLEPDRQQDHLPRGLRFSDKDSVHR